MLASSEGFDEPGNILSVLHRERRHLQASDPTFGAPGDVTDIFVRNLYSHGVIEEFGGFLCCETQINLAQLKHRRARP
jgi:hypothetical protein